MSNSKSGKPHTGGETRPNIVFIMSDDHASMAMSCYGSNRNRTPNMDRIATEGAIFNNCFCTNSICTPSRASILTGLYAHRNGSITFNAPNRECVTFPELLHDDGYFTAAIGKWHLYSEPKGMDTYSVLPGQGEYFNPEFIHKPGTRPGAATPGEPSVERVPGYVTDIITDKTIDVLENRPDDQPFCILCHHKAPHDPWEYHPRHAGDYSAPIAEPPNLFDDYAGRARAVTQSTQRIGSPDPGHTLYEEETGAIADPEKRMRAQYQLYMRHYLRCVAAIDESVGRVLDYLEENGLVENTIVVYTSDQGFFLGEHGWYDKRFMYEESLRMPLVIRYPAAIPAGTTDDRLILNTDFAPTLLDYAGLSAPEAMQGTSFRSALGGGETGPWRDSFYYRYYYSHFNTPAHWGVRTRQHKLIYYHASDEWELYDVVDDAMEMHNLIDEPECVTVAAQLKVRLDELRQEVGDQENGSDGDVRAAALLGTPRDSMVRF